MNPIPDDTRDAAGWTPVRWGLTCLLAGALVLAVGVVGAALCLLAVVLTWTGRAAPPGSEGWFFLAAIGGGVALVGAVVRLVGVFLLSRIPPAAGAGRWASWGVVCLPAAVAVPVYMLWAIGDPLAGEGHVSAALAWAVALAGAVFCWSFCITHILRAAADRWGDPALRRQFRVCFVVTWCGHATWAAGLGATVASEAGLYPGPVIALGQMGWNFFLHRRLRRRIPAGR